VSEDKTQSPIPVREYRYEPLPAEPSGSECEVCGTKTLGRIWIQAEIEIRMPLFLYRTAAPLLCSRCNEELRDHIRRFAEELPPPFHGRKVQVRQSTSEVRANNERTIEQVVEDVLSKVAGRIE
jgi:hypothetical protein